MLNNSLKGNASSLGNMCTNCDHRNLCQTIRNKNDEISDHLKLYEDDVVAYHRIRLELDEHGFSFPFSAKECDYVELGEVELLKMIKSQEELKESVLKIV